MNLHATAIVFGILGAGGCAAPLTLPEAGPDSPANPNAPASPLPQMRTLALGAASGPRPTAVDSRLMPEMHHGVHGMMEMGQEMSGMKHEAPSTEPGAGAAVSAPRWIPTTVPATAPAADSVEHGGRP